ncbi:SIR2 family protein [Halomonas sp. RT37]|uniref:SIR2 family protein n=1 Tax=Halomonas sp. RT37 TaxID=2950872 RepID=A0AAU7KEG8_9GAMM
MTKAEFSVTTSSARTPSPADGLTIERLRTIIQDSHINFLIGAGTSTPYFEQLGDIEEALTQIGESGPDRPAASVARASLQGYFFEKVLVPNLPLIKHADEAKDLIRSYARFVSILNRILLKRRSTLLGKQANIFTTNVDMACEVALELLEIDMNDGFSGKLRPRLDLGEYGTLRIRQGTRYEYRSEIPVINLFKIHGSSSWRQEGNEIYFDHQLAQIIETRAAYESAKQELIHIKNSDNVKANLLLNEARDKSLSGTGKAFAAAYNKLSIVNPEKTKFATTVLNKTYYELIRRLANELEKENCALFVHGFSFRDEHLRDLVLRAAKTNPTLQVVVFCYSRNARDGMSELISEEQIKNGNILFVAPNEPTDGEEEHKITIDVLVDDYLTPLLAEAPGPPDHVIELKLNGSTEGDTDA